MDTSDTFFTNKKFQKVSGINYSVFNLLYLQYANTNHVSYIMPVSIGTFIQNTENPWPWQVVSISNLYKIKLKILIHWV
jgi:hypothetical protein